MKKDQKKQFFSQSLIKGMLYSLTLCIFVLPPYNVLGQDIDFNAGCPNVDELLSPITPGVAIGTPVVIGSVNAPGSVSMEIQSTAIFVGGVESPLCGTPCTSPVSFLGMNISVSGSLDQVTVDGTPDAALADADILFTLRADSNGTQCDRSYSLPVQRPPLDLVVVLDRSGSMGWAYDGSVSPPAGQRRWDGLVTGIGVMSAQLGLAPPQTDDNVGMRYFAGSVIAPAAPFDGGLVSMLTNIAQVPVIAGLQTPGGSTALGDGIIAGRDILLAGSPSHRKAMIVFSDGVQNAGDQIKTVNPNAFVQTVGAQDINGPSDEIDIYTVSLGISGHNPLLMEGIANANGGAPMNSAAGAEADFTTYFSTHLNTILSGSSPQHVNIVRDSFPIADPSAAPPSVEQSFKVNKGVGQVQVTLIAPNRVEPHFTSITKDGIELIQDTTSMNGSGYSSMAISYPVANVPDGTLDGEWSVKAQLGATPKSPTPYTMMFLVDDHLTDVDYDLGGSSLKVGQEINPSIGISRNGEAIKDGMAKAIVVKPGDDVNDLLATMDVEFQVPPEDPGSPGTAKLAVLMQDQAFLDKIAATDQLVDLAYDAGDKRYKGSFDGLDIAGVYQVIYQFSADDAAFGSTVRYHQASFTVRFPDIDQEASGITVTQQDGVQIISMRPIASNGKFIGPGWAGVISLSANDAKVQKIVDHGDGRYDIIIDGVLSGPGSITIDDVVVFDDDLGALSCSDPNANFLQRIMCWLISLGLPGWAIWVILAFIVFGLYLLLKMRN